MTRTAIAYIRVSTDNQKLGPQAQLRELQEYAADNDVTISEIFTEHVSGAAPRAKRTALNAALAALSDRKADLFLAVKRDRIARDLMTMLTVVHEIGAAGAKLITTSEPYITDTPEGKFIATVVDAFGEFERACISRRTKSALAVKRSRGESIGGAKSTLTPEQYERARRYRKAGQTYRDIAVELAVGVSAVKTACKGLAVERKEHAERMQRGRERTEDLDAECAALAAELDSIPVDSSPIKYRVLYADGHAGVTYTSKENAVHVRRGRWGAVLQRSTDGGETWEQDGGVERAEPVPCAEESNA